MWPVEDLFIEYESGVSFLTEGPLPKSESVDHGPGSEVQGRHTQARKTMPPQFQVVKVFPQRGYLCLHRLVKPAAFTCNRCSLGKTSKLVAFAKDKWDKPVCNSCYGYLLAASEINDCARGIQDNPVGVTALHTLSVIT
jgi:hypothetical protein